MKRFPLHLESYKGMTYSEFAKAYMADHEEPTDIDSFEWDELNNIDTGMEWTGSKFIYEGENY